MKLNDLNRIYLAAIASLFYSAAVIAQQGAANGEWRSYGGDTGSTKYSPLKQITKNNVGELEVAWRWNSPDNDLADKHENLKQFRFEATPLMVNGVLYISTGFNQIAAIDAHTGDTIWVHDPGSWRAGRPTNLGFIHRGVSYWTDGDAERILMGTGDAHLIALDAKTGETLCIYNPKSYEDGTTTMTVIWNQRGVAYWGDDESDDESSFPTDSKLFDVLLTTASVATEFARDAPWAESR
ncbi:MAG: PQQ-binding-like beta-propeller repeat protein [Candidatus Hydrogenedentes bacterium]|nr:PQQ-binding-like beta-propeller repeat protein [Candidatus Hydrogenedentota bacterium]